MSDPVPDDDEEAAPRPPPDPAKQSAWMQDALQLSVASYPGAAPDAAEPGGGAPEAATPAAAAPDPEPPPGPDASYPPAAGPDATPAPDATAPPEPDPAAQGPDASYPPEQGPDASYPSEQGPDASYPPEQGPDASNPPEQGPDASYPPEQAPEASYPSEQGPDASYPPEQGSDASYPPEQGPDASYPPEQGPDASYPPEQGPDGSYSSEQGPDSSYPPEQGPDAAYPPEQGPDASYPSEQGPDASYPSEQGPDASYPPEQGPDMPVPAEQGPDASTPPEPDPNAPDPNAPDPNFPDPATPPDTPDPNVPASGAVASAEFKDSINLGTVAVFFAERCFEAKFSVVAEVVGSLDAGTAGSSGTTTVSPLNVDTGSIASRVAHSWNDQNGVNIFGWQSVFTDVKTEGALVTNAEEIKLQATAYGKLGCGVELSFEITLLKVDKDSKIAGFSAKGGLDVPAFPFDTLDIDFGNGVKVNNVRVHPMITLEIVPNWEVIWARWIAKGAARTVGQTVARGTATVISVDTAIVAGIILAGVATIGAGILNISDADDIAATSGLCTQLAAKMNEGFKLGAAGAAPPSDKGMLAGYTMGIRNFNAAARKLQQDNPDATPDDIRRALADQIDQLTAGAQGQITESARQTVWDTYARAHQDSVIHSYESDRWAAWSNIYGNDPRGDPRYAKYRNEHTLGRLGM